MHQFSKRDKSADGTWHTLLYSPIGKDIVLELPCHSDMFDYGGAQGRARWNAEYDPQPQCPIVSYQNGQECQAGAETYLLGSDQQNALFSLIKNEFGDIVEPRGIKIRTNESVEEETFAVRICKHGHLTCTFFTESNESEDDLD